MPLRSGHALALADILPEGSRNYVATTNAEWPKTLPKSCISSKCHQDNDTMHPTPLFKITSMEQQ